MSNGSTTTSVTIDVLRRAAAKIRETAVVGPHHHAPRSLPTWDRVAMRLSIDSDGCWIWHGAKTDGGYGCVRDASGRTVRVHRWVYEHLVGPVSEGLDLDHLCRVRACANPAHLEPVTRRLNTLRGQTIAASEAAQTHCLRGHELAGDNLYTRPGVRPRRVCRTCKRDRAHEYEARKRARLILGVQP